MVLPVYISFLDWASELQVDFPDYNIPFIFDENEWRGWVDSLGRINRFEQLGIPTSDSFSEWRSWAERFVAIAYN